MKKQFVSPEIRVIKAETANILAGSDRVSANTATIIVNYGSDDGGHGNTAIDW